MNAYSRISLSTCRQMFLTEDFANFVDYEGVVEEESQEEAVKRYYSSKAWAGVLKNLIDQLSF